MIVKCSCGGEYIVGLPIKRPLGICETHEDSPRAVYNMWCDRCWKYAAVLVMEKDSGFVMAEFGQRKEAKDV